MGDLKGLYIDPELHKKIKALAAAEGIPLRQYIEQILRDEVQKDDDSGSQRAGRGDRRER